ncbi:MAG: hypothetical protein IKI31_01080 [Treponema sp.]|nr:hypothetical protein [Treponema sp.]
MLEGIAKRKKAHTVVKAPSEIAPTEAIFPSSLFLPSDCKKFSPFIKNPAMRKITPTTKNNTLNLAPLHCDVASAHLPDGVTFYSPVCTCTTVLYLLASVRTCTTMLHFARQCTFAHTVLAHAHSPDGITFRLPVRICTMVLHSAR